MKLQSIEIDLFPEKIDLDLNMKEIWEELINIKEKIKKIDNLKNKEKDDEISNLKNEIEELKNEINNLKNENKEKDKKINDLRNENVIIKNENKEIIKKFDEINKEINYIKVTKSDTSMIMNRYEEESFIFNEIENKINKRIKEIKKLYQATIDGGDAKNFHNKCDDISNTLVLILSQGHRRFGGFTPIPWKSDGGYKSDPEMKTFVFSLDNKKIYYLKKKEPVAVYHDYSFGPCFGVGQDIGIKGNPIKEKTLFTNQWSYDYEGGNQSLSEYNSSNIKALEYEVFQIIFY